MFYGEAWPNLGCWGCYISRLSLYQTHFIYFCGVVHSWVPAKPTCNYATFVLPKVLRCNGIVSLLLPNYYVQKIIPKSTSISEMIWKKKPRSIFSFMGSYPSSFPFLGRCRNHKRKYRPTLF